MERREFVKVCASTAAAAACSPAMALADNPSIRHYNRVKLVDKEGQSLRLKALKTQHNYVFNYPFASTPCFLLSLDKPLTQNVDLKTESGERYQWPGGVGAGRSVVAYSAICAHKLAYPTSQVSFIGFRKDASAVNSRGKVITCCSDKSVYDPYAGAKVVSGPAPQPLAAILLEYDPGTDEVYAVGTYGGEKFNEFFRKYDFKLSLELGPDKVREKVFGTARVSDLAHYSAQTAQC